MFQFDRLPDPVILEALDTLLPTVWYRLAESIPFMGDDWTWHENTMTHLCHPFVLQQRCGGALTVWHKNGHCHRGRDLPAMDWADVCLVWHKNGLKHRDGDLPAEIDSCGTMRWWRRGQLHRDGDAAAAFWLNGDRTYYKNGLKHRDGDQPAVVKTNGRHEWHQEGRLIKKLKVYD